MQWQVRANGERLADLLGRDEFQIWFHSDQREHIRHFDGGGDRYLVVVLRGQFVVENHLAILLDLADTVLRKRLVVRVFLLALHQLKHFVVFRVDRGGQLVENETRIVRMLPEHMNHL